MSDQANPTARAADVLLRAMGGRTVLLRMPAPAVPADPTEQLGLATPQFQDIPLAPCVYRKARATLAEGKPAKSELLVSASAIEALVGSLAYASASVLFANAAGIVAGPAADPASELLEIVAASTEEAHGQPYVYRLILRAPLAQLI
jgi:hypothetical protein